MKKALLICFTFLLLTGCGLELTFTEIKLDQANKNVRTFFESVEDTNGAHLYFAGKKTIYVMLNGKNVILGDKAIHFTNFSVESDDEHLNIYYIEEETESYSDETLKNQVVYKINKDKEYDTIQIFKNGSETHFETVSGN